MNLGNQLLMLVILAIPIACISWSVTHEELFKEPREWFNQKSQTASNLFLRKFFYIFTCEYCFSHYVTVLVLVLFRFTMGYEGWRGYAVAGFSLVWVANMYMSLFGRLRLEIHHERLEIAQAAKEVEGDRP